MVFDWSRNSRGRHGNPQMCKHFSHSKSEESSSVLLLLLSETKEPVIIGVCIWMRSYTAGARSTYVFSIKV